MVNARSTLHSQFTTTIQNAPYHQVFLFAFTILLFLSGPILRLLLSILVALVISALYQHFLLPLQPIPPNSAVLITGAGAGLGKEMALETGKTGSDSVGRSEKRGGWQEVAAVGWEADRAYHVRCDQARADRRRCENSYIIALKQGHSLARCHQQCWLRRSWSYRADLFCQVARSVRHQRLRRRRCHSSLPPSPQSKCHSRLSPLASSSSPPSQVTSLSQAPTPTPPPSTPSKP